MSDKKVISGWMIALINVCAISNIKNFPLLAEYGLSIIVFMTLSALFFFIPVAFISSELASAWPDRGVYTWVKEALGAKWGFLAVWLQWISNVIWYPTVLSFIVATFAYMFDPSLASNKIYVMAAILITFWSVTFLNFLGMRFSSWFSSIAALFGTIIPIALIILMGGAWILTGHPTQIQFSWNKIFPNLTSLNQLVLLSGILLGLAGMEMSAVHAKDVRDPRRDYPKGICFSAVLILIFAVLGALAIAAIVPSNEIQLASGGMEAFKYIFLTFNIPWALPIVAAVTTFGALGMMSTWIVGPSRGLLAIAEDGDLPPIFHKVNKNQMPVSILVTQAIIVTVLSLVFLFMPSVNSSYWILVVLSSILYMIMYVMMFISALVLRKTHAHIPRPYLVPGGKIGLWVICLMGIFGSTFGFIIGFFPPSQVDTGSLCTFECLLIGSCLFFCLLPLVIYACRKPTWRKS